jgi:hypothetical protein
MCITESDAAHQPATARGERDPRMAQAELPENAARLWDIRR